MDALFSGDKKEITATFNMLKPLIKDYLCYEVWRIKGSIHGIHNDFGRHSYLQTNEIGDYYHMSDEDRINFILQMQDLFSNL